MIIFTFAGIWTFVRLLPENEYGSIVWTEDGIINDVKLLLTKAPSLIEVRVLGRVNELIELSSKAYPSKLWPF